MILFQQPFQLQTLVADHSLIPAFVDELCRVHTGSAVASYRVGKEDVRFGNRVGPCHSPPFDRTCTNLTTSTLH